MEFTLHSTKYDAVSTEGMLYDSSGFRFFTLELPWINGLTGAIPAGRFQVVLGPSPKFEGSSDPWVQQYAKLMPHLLNVPNRSYIMIHWGNEAKDTDGCILVGETAGVDFIGSSRKAFEKLYGLLRGPALAGECFITVKRDSAA
jgi:hypothetical protein